MANTKTLLLFIACMAMVDVAQSQGFCGFIREVGVALGCNGGVSLVCQFVRFVGDISGCLDRDSGVDNLSEILMKFKIHG